ncbi:MAG: hypothetical protein IKC87_02410 [Clostridia bacterium]|nr:hypothetical protein [Clostridia bacterium]
MSVTIIGKLPDPFKKDDGSRMTPDEWYANRDKLFEKICEIEYGGMPPRPEVVKVMRLTAPKTDGGPNIYQITAGSKERQLSFLLDVTVKMGPIDGSVKYPLLLTGDGCYQNCESDTINAAVSMGFGVARFNRLVLASDDKSLGRVGGLYDIYPENKRFTAISAWAWGYMTVMDALKYIPQIDAENVGITGHSRGGKTVMLTAAADTRIKFVCPNNSGCHGAVSYRLKEVGYGAHGKTEELSDMLVAFPHWMGPDLKEYEHCEEKLPYDMHFFGALTAPRYYIQCEGMQDYWINPKGAWMNFKGVKEAYRYLGCEDNCAAWFRPGKHRHKLPDFVEFLSFMAAKMQGEKTAEHLKINPYPELDIDIDW